MTMQRKLFVDEGDAAELRRRLSYDVETGVFTWRHPITNAVKAGQIAGSVHSNGYRDINFLGRLHKAHRLAWLYVYGEWPSDSLDHINGLKDDNRIANLRVATCSQNQANVGVRSDNGSGYKGVSFHKLTGKWSATLQHDGKRLHLGLYPTAEEAAAEYRSVYEKLKGEFARAA